MESMYFGDEDPKLLAEHQQAVDDNKCNEPDEVLLFNEDTNDFSFYDGSGEVSVSSGENHSTGEKSEVYRSC